MSQRQLSGGLAEVDISLNVPGQTLSRLSIVLQGQALDGGGLQMSSSTVTLGPASDPSQYRGTVSSLEGTNVQATVRDSSGHTLNVTAALQIDSGTGSASGTVQASP